MHEFSQLHQLGIVFSDLYIYAEACQLCDTVSLTMLTIMANCLEADFGLALY